MSKPKWYNEQNLKRIYYSSNYTGWVIDLCDGTCRYVNEPLLGKNGPKWGDRVPLIKVGNKLFANSKIIIERYSDEIDS